MDNIKDVAKVIFDGVWDLFLQTDFPGTGVSLAAVAISFAVIGFSIRLFGFLTGFGMSGSDYGRAATTAEKYKNDRSRALRGESSKFDW